MADSLYSLERAFALLTTFGYASPNKYFVEFFNLPREVSSIPTLGDQGRLKLACEAVDLPTKNITVDDLKIGHHIRKSATGYTVDPIKLTYRCSRDMVEKVFFDKWLDLVCDPMTGAMEYHSNFTCDVIISVLDGRGEVVYSVQLYEAYPINASSSGLSYQSTNETLKVDVQMAYTKLAILPVGIAGESGTEQARQDLATLSSTLQQSSIQAKMDADRVRTRDPQIVTLGAEAKAFLDDLLIPQDNPAYDWNDYLSNPNAWGTDDPQEAASLIAKSKAEINSDSVFSSISNGGSVSTPTTENAIDILSNQADSVMTVLERLTPFASFL